MEVSPVHFICNICGRENDREISQFGRETPSCDGCQSSVRARSIVYMLSRELFNADMVLPNFPRVKTIRGTGLSDSYYDRQLATLFDYRNTYYHKEPRLDIMNPSPEHEGKYDFVISSEVFEHVPPPAVNAFRNAFRMLKPNGVMLLTIPYAPDENSLEHFPDLNDYGLARLGSQLVLVNRTRDGQIQVFQDLCFHGGDGSTLEIRRFNERELRAVIADGGFESIRIYNEDYRPFGVVHRESWSLPIAARKLPYSLPLEAAGEILDQWTQTLVRAHGLEMQCEDLSKTKAQFVEFHRWANEKIAELEGDLQSRTEWAQGIERQLGERTEWAVSLNKDLEEHAALVKKLESELGTRTEWAQGLDAEVQALRARLEAIEGSRWVRAGRVLGFLK